MMKYIIANMYKKVKQINKTLTIFKKYKIIILGDIMDDMTFKVDEDGKEKEYKIVKYTKNPNNNKSYIIYHELNDSELYASSYHIQNGEVILDTIDSDEEWDYLDEIINMEEENV